YDLQADIRLFKDNRLLKFKPHLLIRDHEPVDLRGYQIEEAPQDKRPLPRIKQRIYAKPDVPPGNFDDEAWELDQFAKHAGLTDLEQIALGFMRRNTRRTDTEIAEVLGISQGYYSKLKDKIVLKLREGRKRLYGAPESSEIWSHIEYDIF